MKLDIQSRLGRPEARATMAPDFSPHRWNSTVPGLQQLQHPFESRIIEIHLNEALYPPTDPISLCLDFLFLL